MELTIEQALQQGVAAHKEGKVQDAERLYRAILQSQPLHPNANHNLGVLAVLVNKADAALPLFKTALEANSKIEQFWLSYIDALIKTEKVDDARRVLVDAQQAGVTAAKLQIFEEKLEFKLSPSSQIPQQEISNPLHSHQGELSSAIELREVGKYKEAQKWLSNVIEHGSKNPEALSLLSQVLLLDKKEVESERVLTAAASINSELPSVYRNQARLLLKQSKTVEALEKAQLGCRQSPEDLESLLVLAACLGANQRDLEALPIIEKILEAESNYAEAYANRALIKLRAKDTVGAIEDAKMTISLKPHLTQMWQLLGSLYYQSSNLIEAIKALRIAHKNEPKNTAFMVQLGEFLRQDNKASEAITILEQATELAPKDANAWTNLGVAFQQETRIADAKIAYGKALALNPKSAAISSNLGAMAQEAKEWESALQYFGKALEIEPNLAQAHSNLGNTLKELGRLDEAEASFRQAIALKPDYAEAHYNLGNTLKELGRLDEAVASYTQAIAFTTGAMAAHRNLAGTLRELGKIEQAIESERYSKFLNSSHVEATVSKKFSDDLPFRQPSPLEHPMLYRAGMGTENVGGFLRAMAQMLRPKNILEIGAGYTTPFLLEALINNERVFDDGNLAESYFKDYVYDSKLVVIDNISLGELSAKPGMADIISSKYTEFIEGNFEGRAKLLHERYGYFDFVWFDCGSNNEYKNFIDEYWDICSDYIFFHYTYSNGRPNGLHDIIRNSVAGDSLIFDIVEPHKMRQGSITMVRKK
jgi:tetratricopeptide (TPR) repeat protein